MSMPIETIFSLKLILFSFTLVVMGSSPTLKKPFTKPRKPARKSSSAPSANPSRVYKSKIAEEVLEAERKGANLEELLPMIRMQKSRPAVLKGDVDNALMVCGQVDDIMDDIPTIKEAVDSIIREAKEVYEKIRYA